MFFYGSQLSSERICNGPTLSPACPDGRNRNSLLENRKIQEILEIWEIRKSEDSGKSKKSGISLPETKIPDAPNVFLRQPAFLRADLQRSDTLAGVP